MKEYKFTSVLEPAGGGGVFIAVPFDVEKEFGKSRVKIRCTIDGEPYRGTILTYGTPYHIIIVLKAIREKINKGAGDKVKIWLIEDTEERSVEIPDGFKKLLVKEKLLKQFEKMSYTHRKEWVLWINDARKGETRLKRMDKTITKLKEKSTLNK